MCPCGQVCMSDEQNHSLSRGYSIYEIFVWVRKVLGVFQELKGQCKGPPAFSQGHTPWGKETWISMAEPTPLPSHCLNHSPWCATHLLLCPVCGTRKVGDPGQTHMWGEGARLCYQF